MANNKYKAAIILMLISFSFTSSYAREVKHIDIKETGISDKKDSEESGINQCEEFKPQKAQLIHFFRLAREEKEYGSALHEYYSPCITTGTVSFKDGTSGDWKLRSSGLATVFFNNGETSTFFYRNNKWKDPYACNYGLGDEPEC